MSYDLTARHDDRFSRSTTFERAAAVVAAIPDVQPNGTSGFVLQRGDAMRMEIDLESVDDEGDSMDPGPDDRPAEVNCIRFHVPHGFAARLDECIEVAARIAGELDWDLHDEQTGETVARAPARKPWWRFW